MGLRLNRLYPASFRGVEFWVRLETQTEAGRKTALHEFPNSDQRFVEDLGQVVPRFTVDAFVHGEFWRNIANDLEKELNTAGPGKLVMPTFGSRTVYPLPYTKDASQQAVGEISYRLEFAIGDPSTTEIAIPDQQQIWIVGDTSRGLLATVFAAIFAAPAFINNLLVAAQDLQNGLNRMLDDFESIISGEVLEDFVDSIRDLGNRAAELITTPVEFAKDMIQGDDPSTGLWQITSEGFGSDGNIDAILELTEFGADLTDTDISGAAVVETEGDETSSNTPYWPEDTKERIDRNANRRTFVRMMRLSALVCAYEQLSAATYTTSDQIKTARNKVETAYKNVMLDAGTGSLQLDNQLKIAIENVRSASLAVLEQKEQEVFGITQLDFAYPISQFSLAYLLYAEEFTNASDLTERAQIVRGLNPSVNGISMTGELNILETT